MGTFKLNFTVPATAGFPGGSLLLDRCLGYVELAFLRLEKLVGLPNGLAPLGADGLVPPEFFRDPMTPSTLMVSATGAPNAAVTATLPAVAGKFHFITSIQLVRGSAAALAGGTLVHTSTNLPGNPAWLAGATLAAGQAITDLDFHPTTPLRSLAAGVATTIVMPAAGATAINRINVSYYVADANGKP